MSYSNLHPWRNIRPWERHSLVLMVAGFVYVVIGWSFFATELAQSNEKALRFALSWWSMDVWGGVFAISGLLAMVSSRWPPISATWGYTVLTGLSAGWGAFYGVGVTLGSAPMSNLRGALTWSLVAFMWWAISGLSNPARVIVEVKTTIPEILEFDEDE